MFWSRSKGVVGLDVGSSSIKLVELKERKAGEFSLVRVGVEPLSLEAIVDGRKYVSGLELIRKGSVADLLGSRVAV